MKSFIRMSIELTFNSVVRGANYNSTSMIDMLMFIFKQFNPLN